MSLFLVFEESSAAEDLIGSQGEITSSNIYSTSDNESSNCNSSQVASKRNTIEKPITNKAKTAWSFVLVIMSSFFLAAAYVQHNDPDPYIWMAAYLVPSGVNFVVLFFALRPSLQSSTGLWRFINRIITIHICYCYTLGFWTLAHYIHRQIWEDDHAQILAEMVSEQDMLMEEAKELIGLCLVIAWCSLLNNGNFLKFGRRGIMFGSLLTALPIVSWILVEKLEEKREQSCF